MKVDEWKAELNQRAENIIKQFSGIYAHINKLGDMQGDFDEDEMAAYMLIKLNKMNAAIEKLCEE